MADPHVSAAALPKPVVALVWGQFAAYHVDRCEAVAARLAPTHDVLAIEVATTSEDYAWEASGGVAGARKLTLYPGRSYETVPWFRRCWAMFKALRRADWALFGIPYSDPAVILLSWLLPLFGVRCVMLTESKFDDFPRRPFTEWLKARLLSPYRAAIVGGRRSFDYARMLGFHKRQVLPGYDAVGLARVRTQGGPPAPAGPAFATRPFVFVGRFVAKKNLTTLLRAYALYRQQAGSQARRLVLAGDGPQRAELADLAAKLGISDNVEFTGFLSAPQVAQRLSAALALLLVSTEEQWGLVVNEALAFNLPVIVSLPVGARDALVRSGVNGYAVEAESVEGIARAMLDVGNNQADWARLCAASAERAWLGDAERFADAAEVLIAPPAAAAAGRIGRFKAELGLADG